MSKDEGGRNSSFSEKPVRSRPRRLADWINPTGTKKVHSLIDKVYKRKNLEMAWEKVKEQRLLAHPVVNRGYTKHPILSRFVPLRDRVLANRQRPISILLQLSVQPNQLLVQLRFEGPQTLPINTSATSVLQSVGAYLRAAIR